ncbi:MAG: SdpI family protein [Lachnospiraceae bacterium]|nr:SdpI family protein [Lachnospiraceae bacterium]MBQ8634144.1 SdpI family protein [Lachnospiraceae bacterium]
MNRKKMILLTSLLVLIPMIVGLVLWNKLPEEIPVHFNADGNPDNWESKPFSVFFIPLFLWVVHLLTGFITLADPKKQNISDKIFMLILYIAPAASIFGSIVMYTGALNLPVSVNMVGNLFLGIIFIVVGNYMPKTRQNYTIGIKIPWALNDEENWNKTHRFAGIIWVICGAVLIINAFLDIIWIVPASIAVAALLPTAYSFLLYLRKSKNTEQ